MERSREVKYRNLEDESLPKPNELETARVSDSSSSHQQTDRGKSVIYRSDPIHLAAHKDYQKWVNLPEPYRERYGIVGDPLSHFFRLHEEKAKSKLRP